MYGANQFDQDDLILQLKNMPKPPISKELAKEIGFDPKKYEGMINNLLCQIHEVRKERLKEKYLFDEKLKTLQYNAPTKAKMNSIKNKLKKNNTKNSKINLNRPKSNYKSIKSSGYGITPKKINIFSTRPRKKTKDIKNIIPVGQKVVNKKSKNILTNNKSNHSLNKINNNMNNINEFYTFKNMEINNNNNSKVLKGEKNDINNINKNLNNFNSIGNNLININENNYKRNNNKPPLTYYDEIMKEIEKMQNQNKLIEERYQNISNEVPQNKIINNEKTNISQDKNKKINNLLKNNNNNQSNQSKYKIYEDVIKSNVQLISKDIIDDLLYELILDLKKIEDKRAEKQRIEKENKIKKILNLDEDKKKLKKKVGVKNKNIQNQIKFIAEPNQELINKCNKSKNDFKKFMILKGSFFTNDIFKIYDDFVEEMSKSVIEQGLNFYIKQMEDFIKKIEIKK